jgi:hypothetical protein
MVAATVAPAKPTPAVTKHTHTLAKAAAAEHTHIPAEAARAEPSHTPAYRNFIINLAKRFKAPRVRPQEQGPCLGGMGSWGVGRRPGDFCRCAVASSPSLD